MSVVSSSSTSSQSIASMVIQQLMSGTNASATAGLSPSVLQAVLKQTGATAQSDSTSTTPAAITQALGDLLSGGASSQSDLSQLQAYFKQNPDHLASLLTSLQNGSGTYGADGTVNANTGLLATLAGSSSSNASGNAASTSSILSSLLGSQAQDPLLASLGLSSTGSGSTFSMLG